MNIIAKVLKISNKLNEREVIKEALEIENESLKIIDKKARVLVEKRRKKVSTDSNFNYMNRIEKYPTYEVSAEC